MELKQLEYFTTTADAGSFSRAADLLYTSQPNVSKNINALERSLGCSLFFRSSKGVYLTAEGSRLYEYAQNILKNASLMQAIVKNSPSEKFSVSCYPSHMISRIFCDHHNRKGGDGFHMEFLEGTLEETVNHVDQHRSEVGIVYFTDSQQGCMSHLLDKRKIEFQPLASKAVCVYAGRNSELFSKSEISFSELQTLRFVQSSRDFFSVEHQLAYISGGLFREEAFNIAVSTNCDNLLIDMLMHTDLCNLGIEFMISDYEQYGIRCVPIAESTPCLLLGFIKKTDVPLSANAQEFLEQLRELVQTN